MLEAVEPQVALLVHGGGEAHAPLLGQLEQVHSLGHVPRPSEGEQHLVGVGVGVGVGVRVRVRVRVRG